MKVDIHNYIRELLLLNDCVILPGFGGFISKYQPACIDESTLSFQPPSKKIVFNHQLIHNDGLLINYVSVVHKISYSESKKIVSDFICKLYTDLDKNKNVYFQSLGSFSYNNDHSIRFESEQNISLLQEAFGLSSFHFPEISPAEISVLHDQQTHHEKQLSGSFLKSKVFIASIIILPLIISLGIVTINTDLFPELKKKYFAINSFIDDTITRFKKFNEQDVLNNPNSVEASILQLTSKRNALYYEEKNNQEAKQVTEETPVKENSEEFINNTSEAKETIKENKEIEKTVLPETKKESNTAEYAPEKYYIIAGSFGNLDNAKNCTKSLAGNGYNPIILDKVNGLYRVALKALPDRNSANIELASIKAKTTDFNVWVLSPK